jgi:hypothetical protein
MPKHQIWAANICPFGKDGAQACRLFSAAATPISGTPLADAGGENCRWSCDCLPLSRSHRTPSPLTHAVSGCSDSGYLEGDPVRALEI